MPKYRTLRFVADSFFNITRIRAFLKMKGKFLDYSALAWVDDTLKSIIQECPHPTIRKTYLQEQFMHKLNKSAMKGGEGHE